MLNNNEAYKWLREWLDNGYWNYDAYAGVWPLALGYARSYSRDGVGFEEDMRQLLADAEAGRKLRENNK
jgi:hypothetical protein